ncbi:MAG: hypothetical protein GYA14_14520 [Ignavibacteria bacterium]|nr:hypothetical protein [Ignavibacteria bacterium]
MANHRIKLQDIEFDLRLVNITMLSKASGFSHTYCRQLLYGEKKNPKALWKLRNTVVKLYGLLIKYVPYELKLNSKEAA